MMIMMVIMMMMMTLVMTMMMTMMIMMMIKSSRPGSALSRSKPNFVHFSTFWLIQFGTTLYPMLCSSQDIYSHLLEIESESMINYCIGPSPPSPSSEALRRRLSKSLKNSGDMLIIISNLF